MPQTGRKLPIKNQEAYKVIFSRFVLSKDPIAPEEQRWILPVQSTQNRLGASFLLYLATEWLQVACLVFKRLALHLKS